MKGWNLVGAVGAVACITSASVATGGQATSGWSVPRTPWGDPALQGTYTNKTITPVQRPAELADREFLTEEEVTTLERERLERNEQLLLRPAVRTAVGNVDQGVDGAPGAYNNFWLDGGTRPTGRTSLIIDPSNGRIPGVTSEFERVATRRAEGRQGRGPADGWEDFQLNDRCIVWSAGPPIMPGPYNNTYMIFQTPDYVAIEVEMIHDTRIIPLGDRPHLPSSVRQYLGDSRGRWEGDTLVVETTNIARTNGDPGTQGSDVIGLRAANGRADDTIRVIERFTLVDADTFEYEFTIEDPSRWTRDFSGAFPFERIDGHLYEYACHEGNYSMPTMLAGERLLERAASR